MQAASFLIPAFIVAALAVPSASAQSARCESMKSFQAPGVELTITSAEVVPAAAAGTAHVSPNSPATIPVAMPAYCRVDGVIDQRTGAGGTTYGIGFAVALPDNWSGRFLFQGGGGLNGSVATPLGGTAAGDEPALARGFAVVTTDTGHKGSVFDGSFMADQQASLDFNYVAIGRVANLAKQIVAAYYSKPADHSYFAGCSTGGREAMIMSQRYPTYFDGIISGAPAMRTGHSNLALAYIGSVFAKAAAADENDQPGSLLSDADKDLILKALMEACDARDGIEDGMIFDQRGCDFDPTDLACDGAKSDDCLLPAQAEAVKKAFAGPKDIRGDQIYPGYPFDGGITETGGLPGLLHGPRIPVRSAPSGDFDPDRAAADLNADVNRRLGDSTWTNLSTFAGHGGKLIFFHGVSDPWFSPADTVGYYERMTAVNGGRETVESWSRVYLVPGMGHCGGGSATLDRFDLLSAVVDWVEKDEAPDGVVATGNAFPGRSRPLCAYPKHAQYTGQGNPNDAVNFTCVE